MNYNEFNELKEDYVLGKLSDSQFLVVEQFITENPKVIGELDDLKVVLNFDNPEIPERIEERMDSKFYAFLKSEREKVEPKVSILDRLKYLFDIRNMQGKLVYGLSILAIGFLLGKGLPQKTDVPPAIVESNSSEETEKVRTQLVMELIEQPSATKRLQAVSEASKLNNVTEQIVNALFITLNNDDNVNVRLAALESLMKYSEKPIVRQGLIKSIETQDSPLVQVALADIMVSLQDKNCISPLKELIEQPDVDSSVKEKINKSIQQII